MFKTGWLARGIGPGTAPVVTAFAVALVFIACASDRPHEHPLVLSATPGPSALSGYGSCTEPGCADLARACDDVIRSGCGGVFYAEKAAPEPGSEAFLKAIQVCTSNTYGELQEASEATGAIGGVRTEAEDDKHAAMLALEAARCTRRAQTCQARFDCLRGQMIGPRPVGPTDAGVRDSSPPPPKPEWTRPYRGDDQDPAIASLPWAEDGGTGRIELISGVDSYSCARCAVSRCPAFAYRCFAAGDDAVDCPGGDCCHSMRRCIRNCGGYDQSAGPSEFYACLAKCEAGRPHAAQQLADLQGCAKVGCAGCEAWDSKQPLATDAGIAGPSDAADGGP